MINGKYIQNSRIFHTLQENKHSHCQFLLNQSFSGKNVLRRLYCHTEIFQETHTIPTCRWGGFPPAVSGLGYSNLPRGYSGCSWSVLLYFGVVIVSENDWNVDCTAKHKMKAIYTKKAKCPEKSELLRAVKMWCSSIGSHMGKQSCAQGRFYVVRLHRKTSLCRHCTTKGGVRRGGSFT